MSSKKAKIISNNNSDNNSDWKIVQDYILACPHVSPDHPAIHAAVHGLQTALQRTQRDAKLHQKFAKSHTTTNRATPAQDQSMETHHNNTNTAAAAPSAQQEENDDNDNDDNDETMSDDWQDVHQEQDDDLVTSTPSSSLIGDQLAAQVVQLIAQHKVRVASPVAAMAVALHASILSVGGFVCTGIPPSTTSPIVSGFAPPVRPLAADQFLPPEWDAHASSSSSQQECRVSLRYRHESVGSVNLTVEQVPASNNNNMNEPGDTRSMNNNNETIQVTWKPSHATEPTICSFDLHTHWNRESWNTASQNGTQRAEPALHYKRLAVLMTQWVQSMDWGESLWKMMMNESNGAEETSTSQPAPYTDGSVIPLQPPQPTRGAISSSQPQPVLPQQPRSSTTGGGYPIPTTLDSAFPLNHAGRGMNHGGHFSGDLFPSTTNPEQGGNLMGPGHPAFGGGNGHGNFLQPRYDPYGPPADPTNIPMPPNPNHPGQQPRRPRGPHTDGNPNNDHFRPPNNLNNNMFL